MSRLPPLTLIPLLLAIGCQSQGDDNDIAKATTTTSKRQGATTRRSRSSKIMGGTEAAPNKYPFYAYWDQGCGATLIAPDLLLSAAHCYIDGEFGTMWLGSVNYEEGFAYEVVQVWYHPFFNGDYFSAPEYDFLIARVNESIPETVATTVTLNTNPNIPTKTGETLVAIGFGSLDEDAKEWPDVLNEVKIPFLETWECQLAWGGEIIDAEMCTVDPEGGKDSCYGDSGGPVLTWPDLHQVGVVSWGDGCGRPEDPAVGARVSAVAESWIQPHICLYSQFPPDACQEEWKVNLPLSLRLDIFSTSSSDINVEQAAPSSSSSSSSSWKTQNISFGLYQVTPPETIYLVENGVTIVNNHNNLQVPFAEVARRKEDKDKDREQAEEVVAEDQAALSIQFENLSTGLYYFRISQEVETMLERGTFERFTITQGGGTPIASDFVWESVVDNDASLPQAMERSWVDLMGSSFEGFSNKYIDLQPTYPVSEVQLAGSRPSSQEDPAMVELTLDMFYDEGAPSETLWELRDRTASTVLLQVLLGEVKKARFESYKVEVPAGSSLRFRIWDQAGDGMCCGDKGDGWVEIWAGLGRIWAFDGIFENEFVYDFEV